jgi:hypothetical protein
MKVKVKEEVKPIVCGKFINDDKIFIDENEIDSTCEFHY